jgi:hypothetical protein
MADKTLIHNAIAKGIERAADAGMTKTYDIALFVGVELDKKGLRIVSKPRKDGFIRRTVKSEFNRVGNDKVTGQVGSK